MKGKKGLIFILPLIIIGILFAVVLFAVGIVVFNILNIIGAILIIAGGIALSKGMVNPGTIIVFIVGAGLLIFQNLDKLGF